MQGAVVSLFLIVFVLGMIKRVGGRVTNKTIDDDMSVAASSAILRGIP